MKELQGEDLDNTIKEIVADEKKIRDSQLPCRNTKCLGFTFSFDDNCSRFDILKYCNNYTIRFHDLQEKFKEII